MQTQLQVSHSLQLVLAEYTPYQANKINYRRNVTTTTKHILKQNKTTCT